MDHKLTQKIIDYLNTIPSERDVVIGATLLLQLNRNRILYQNACKRPDKFTDKIEYELQKHLNIRIDHKTIDDVARMTETVLPSASSILNQGAPIIQTNDDGLQSDLKNRGMRADHEELPDEIKQLWIDNGQLFFKIKALFEQLKSMEQAPACDRYEYLKQLAECDRQYRDAMNLYDNYKEGDELPIVTQPTNSSDPAEITKKVNAARKYLSDNKKKLPELKGDDKKYNTLLGKMQERFDFLISTGNSIDADQVAELVALGLKA